MPVHNLAEIDAFICLILYQEEAGVSRFLLSIYCQPKYLCKPQPDGDKDSPISSIILSIQELLAIALALFWHGR